MKAGLKTKILASICQLKIKRNSSFVHQAKHS